MDFLILYEHVVREYESILLLKLELEKRGYKVKIQQLLDRKRIINYLFPPKVIVTSCMYDDEAVNSHVYNNVGRCNKVVNLHWEQMLSDTQEKEAWFNFAGAAKRCIQTCWGNKTRERLIANGVNERNCPVTGAVMMDFLRPEFSGYFKDKNSLCEQYNLDKNKKLVLYISSFGYASMTTAEVKELSDMAGVDFSGFAETNKISMEKTIEYFDKYLSLHDDIEIVYRRHPSEWASSELANLEKRQPHFHVIFEDSVKQWIVAADKIYIWMSTAIAEVYFAHKNCTVLRPVPVEHEYDPVIYKNAQIVSDYDGFADSMENDNKNFPIASQVIEGYFDSAERPAYMRMADLLESVYKEPPRDIVFDNTFKPHANILKFFALWGVHIFSALHFNPTPISAFAGRIYGYVEKAKISKKDISEMEEKIKKYINKE
ncbi:MAG: hypothetical protein RR508_01400 [Oscillospiraceae bacterium]